MICMTGCADCAGAKFCNKAIDGYYTVSKHNGRPSGRVKACRSPCMNCKNDKRLCTGCITDYTLNGSSCISNSKVSLKLTLSSSGSSPLFSSTDSASTVSAGMRSINRLLISICNNLPSKYYDTSSIDKCFDLIIFSYLGAGSLIVANSISGGSFSSPAEANSAIGSSFTASTALDGVSVLTVTSAASGFTTPSASTEGAATSSNLGLILGLSIPLVLLCTNVVI